jgi:hypothetical protein
VIVPNDIGKDVPDAAVALPSTGGQKLAQDPLQFDFVGVSMANQYSVWPCELTSTVPMPVLRVLTATLPDAGVLVPDCGVVAGVDVFDELGDELPHAAIADAAAAASRGAAQYRLRMMMSPFRWPDTFLPHTTDRWAGSFTRT